MAAASSAAVSGAGTPVAGPAGRDLFAEGLLEFLRPAVQQLDSHVHAVRSEREGRGGAGPLLLRGGEGRGGGGGVLYRRGRGLCVRGAESRAGLEGEAGRPGGLGVVVVVVMAPPRTWGVLEGVGFSSPGN